jgi:hypothetical protein
MSARFPDPMDEDGSAVVGILRAAMFVVALVLLIGLMAMTCGCSARSQQAPIIRPPEVIEIKVPVPVPCPAPPEVPPLDLWLPMLDPDKADVQTIMRVIAHDLAACVMSYEQAVELLRIYVQQGEVASAPATPTPER